MAITIRWKAVSITAIFTLSLLICVLHYYPMLLPLTSSISGQRRRLMNDDTEYPACKELEQQLDTLQAIIGLKDQKNAEDLDRFRAQNTETRKKLEVQREIVKDLERRNRQLIEKISSYETGSPRKPENDYRLAPYISPEILRTINIHQNNEFEVIPFTSFTKDRLFQLESGMINKPVVGPVGNKKKEHSQVLELSLEILNDGVTTGRPYTDWDLVQGYYRIDRIIGTQYELFFRTKARKNSFQHIQLVRPFAPIQKVKVQTYDKKNEWINLIVPLSGRVETFRQFMELFVEQCIKKDGRVFLTVVYFGEEGRQEVKEILESTTKENHYTHYKLIERKDNFSRGIGLLAGAEAWKDGNSLLFFCDVDVAFKEGFLDRCRLNAVPGTRVYYPIVFSLYNPSIVYSDQPEIPSWKDQLVLTRNSGFWRTFGFGMTCMYRSDFLFMRGFDTKIQGWGLEDVKLYKKLVASNLNVVRAPDAGIFHLWHEKKCDPHLQPSQYNSCLGSKALGEASHIQLGMLAFHELKRENERLHHHTPDVNMIEETIEDKHYMELENEDFL